MKILFALFGVVSGLIVDCGSKFEFTALALDPEPPVPGSPVLMTVQFTNPGPEINAGTVTSSLTLNGLPFSPTMEELCVNTQCPIIQGYNDRSAKSDWPAGVSGKIVSRIVWDDVDNTQLLCIEITEKI